MVDRLCAESLEFTSMLSFAVPGTVIGLFKGIGMTVYRAVFGAFEAGFFLIPAPGCYDPMTNPAYVWQGWGPKPSLCAGPVSDRAPDPALNP